MTRSPAAGVCQAHHAGHGATPRSRSAVRAGLGAVLLANAFWSFGGVLGKSVGTSGVVLSFWRMWVASAAIAVVAVVLRRWPSWSEIRRAAPLGLLFGLNICAFFTTLQYLSVAVALIIGALTPVVALPVAVTVMRERLTVVKVVCAAVAVVGVVVAVLAAPADQSGSDRRLLVGYAWGVVSLVVWVAYLLASKRVRDQVETVRFMVVMSVVGALTVSVLVVVVRADIGRVEGEGWLWVVLLALGPGLMGHGLLAWAQPRVDASVTSLLLQAEPIGASVAAWAVLGERVTLVQAMAMVVVITALAVLAVREARDAGTAPIVPAAESVA